LANMVHPVHRGQKLPAFLRRDALEKVKDIAEKLKVHPPEISELLSFMGFEAPFEEKMKEGGKVKMSAFHYWK